MKPGLGACLATLMACTVTLLCGCGASDVKLTFSSGSEGGLYLPLARAMAKAVGDDHPHIQLEVVESPGSQANLGRIERGEADLALAQNDSKGDDTIRTLAPIYRDVLHFVVRRDSGIERLSDIRGRRVSVSEEGSGTEVVVRELTRHYGITYDDFQPAFLDPTEAADQLIAGKIDAMIFMVGLKSPVCEQVVASGKVQLIGLGSPGVDQGEVAGFRLEYPFVEAFIIPVSTYAGGRGDALGEPENPVATVAARTLLVAHKSLPDEVARSITESIFNSRAELIQTHQTAAQLTERYDPMVLHFPIHPGAQAYYDRNEPPFLVQYAELMAFLLSAVIAAFAGFTGIKSWVVRTKKNRIDVYYARLEKILDHLENSPTLPTDEIDEIAEQLGQIRRTAFQELIAERLRADESFRIFQVLLSECQAQLRRMPAAQD